MDLLLEDDYIQVFEHPDIRVIRVVRSNRRGEQSELLDSYRAALGAIRAVHASWGVVLDMRKAPGRSDKEFEQSTGVLRAELESCVARIVTLMSTAVGKLQANRIARESGHALNVTQDEAEAMRWASQG